MFSNPNLFSNNTPQKSPHLNIQSTQLPPQQTNSPQKNLILPITSNSLKNNNINSGNPNANSQHSIKLTPYIEPESKLGIPSKMITLVSLNEGSLHFHDEAANVFQRYQNNDIAFVGIWGSENSDKSFFYDRLLYLADVDADKYLNASIGNSNSLLYFYERPFIKDKIRFFLVDCKGYRNPSSLTKVQRNSLDLLISICQIIILIQSPHNPTQKTDIVQDGYQHINQSFRRLYIDKKKKQQPLSEICWPKSLFLLYNTSQSIKKHKNSQQTQQQLCRMFKDYNFSILHNKNNNINSQQQIKSYTSITEPLDQLYLKNASMIFRQIYEKIQGKNYMNIKFNGFTCPHIMNQTVYTLNQHENLYLPKSFNKAKKSVFSSMYNRYALAYLLKMKQFIGEQKPYSTDYLLKAFQNVSEQTMQQYHQTQNQITLRPAQDSLCLQYERKLQEYIEQKQKNILAVNNKKSAKQLNNILAGNPDPYQQLKKIQKSVIQNNRNFDQNAQSLFVGNSIKQILASGIKNPPPQVCNNNASKAIEFAVYNELQAQKQRQQISRRQQQYIKKKVELQVLSSAQQMQNQQVNQQVNRFKNQQMMLEQEINNQQKRLVEFKSKAALAKQSQSSRGSNDALIESTRERIQQLRKLLKTKITERRQVQQMASTNNIVDPQLQMLQTRLIDKKIQLQLVKKSGIKPAQLGPAKAERRLISAHDANIRRVHGSRI